LLNITVHEDNTQLFNAPAFQDRNNELVGLGPAVGVLTVLTVAGVSVETETLVPLTGEFRTLSVHICCTCTLYAEAGLRPVAVHVMSRIPVHPVKVPPTIGDCITTFHDDKTQSFDAPATHDHLI
jgi:hypothetical protein